MRSIVQEKHTAPKDGDSSLAGRIKQVGLNVSGSTTTPEFGLCSSADNPFVYVTRTPQNLAYTTCSCNWPFFL